MLVHFDTVAVKFEFGGVKQRFAARETGNNVINCFDEVDNVSHCTVGHCGGNIARDRVGERRLYVGERKLLFPGAFSVENIAETLNHYMTVSEHIGKFADFLSKFNRLIERYREVVRTKYREVCIGRFKLLIAVTVYNRQIVVIIFLTYKTARILAERAHLILERQGITYKL